jgi:LPXTG-motif cell wall-anchored protein
LTFTFDITKEIIQEAVPAVEEIKTLYYVGYQYENGCKVMFNKELELTDIELLDAKKPFTPGRNKVWSGRLFWKVYLYKACDWECPAPSTSPPETTPPETTEPTTPPPATTEVIETTEIIQTTPPATINTEVTETNTIVKNNAENLPKTGENSPINYMIIGAIVLVAGLFLFLRLRLN